MSKFRFRSRIVVLVTLLTLLLSVSSAFAYYYISFDSYAVGTRGSTLGIPGVAFYGSPDSEWIIYPAAVFSTLSGNVLMDPVASPSTPTSTLKIKFDALQRAVSFQFGAAPAAGAPWPIQIEGYRAGVLVYTDTVTGSVPPGGSYYEGSVYIGVPVDTVRLHVDAPGFAIDNFSSKAATD